MHFDSKKLKNDLRYLFSKEHIEDFLEAWEINSGETLVFWIVMAIVFGPILFIFYGWWILGGCLLMYIGSLFTFETFEKKKKENA